MLSDEALRAHTWPNLERQIEADIEVNRQAIEETPGEPQGAGRYPTIFHVRLEMLDQFLGFANEIRKHPISELIKPIMSLNSIRLFSHLCLEDQVGWFEIAFIGTVPDGGFSLMYERDLGALKLKDLGYVNGDQDQIIKRLEDLYDRLRSENLTR